MTEEKFTFFWKHQISQWHRCNFIVNEITYICAEQYMMAEKARLFEDKKTEEKIMNSLSPYEQKKLGRQVENFQPKIWDEHARDIVYKGNYAKFDQNRYLKELIFESAGTTLVEASPFDHIWGIGLESTDRRAHNRETWRGKNWLGEVLTRVRDDLMKKENIE